MADVKLLRELLAKASPGAWNISGEQFSGSVRVSAGTPANWNGLIATCDAGDYARSKAEGRANAELIAAMHEALPELLAIAEAYEAMTKERDEWKARAETLGQLVAERNYRDSAGASMGDGRENAKW